MVADTAHPGDARRIPLPDGPHEVVALTDGRVVVSLAQSAALAVLDLRRGDLPDGLRDEQVQTLPIGGTPHGLAVAGDTLYVTDRSVGAVRRFAIGTWEEHTSVATGAWPHILALTPDGSLAIANAADDTLTLGDRTLPVSHVPESVAVASDGRVATGRSVGGTLDVFDAAGATTGRYELGGRPVRLLYDARGRVLAAALSASGAVAILADGELRRIPVGGVPDGLAFSPDGRWLYVGDMFGGAVSVIDLDRSRVVQRFPVGRSAGALLVPPPAIGSQWDSVGRGRGRIVCDNGGTPYSADGTACAHRRRLRDRRRISAARLRR